MMKFLLLKIEEFKSVIENAARLRAPYLLCKYAQELGASLHHFYNYTRVITSDKEETKARMTLVYVTKIAMELVLELIGVSAPEKM